MSRSKFHKGVMAYAVWTDPSTDDRVTLFFCIDLHLFESRIEHLHELIGSDVGR
jgi:hypothetical protein